ncbi:MAG: RnfABCDGE type electron transport complex subunit B, partial [Sterolibacterium sp.]|nr:RnfABCDGE type electron transport complex subunit B [Sterolibacterium sp.]
GGEEGIRKLADLLGREFKPLSAEHGEEKPKAVAYIDESTCIGCTLCLQACPVDAIVGAAKQMHTIVADQCTGCELCIPPCPVDCISMVPLAETVDTWKWKYPLIEIKPVSPLQHRPAIPPAQTTQTTQITQNSTDPKNPTNPTNPATSPTSTQASSPDAA